MTAVLYPLCSTCWDRKGAVLFEGAFLCSPCALILIGDMPARQYAAIDCALAATKLIAAIDEELAS